MEQHISGRRMIIRLFIMKRGDMRTRIIIITIERERMEFPFLRPPPVLKENLGPWTFFNPAFAGTIVGFEEVPYTFAEAEIERCRPNSKNDLRALPRPR